MGMAAWQHGSMDSYLVSAAIRQCVGCNLGVAADSEFPQSTVHLTGVKLTMHYRVRMANGK